MGHTQNRQPGHRRVEPIDLQAGLAASIEDDECEALRRSLAQSNEIASALCDAADDATFIGHQMRALMYMYLQAIEGCGNREIKHSASHLVIDIVETMAKRLDGIGERANVLYGPLRPRARAA